MKPFLTALLVAGVTIGSLSAQTAAEAVERGKALEKKGQTQEALAAYLEADKLKPNQSDVLVSIAMQYVAQMRNEEKDAAREKLGEQALSYARKATKTGPKNADAHVAVAVALAKLVDFGDNGDKADASREIKDEADKALDLDPKNDNAHHILGRWNQKIAGMGAATRALAGALYGGMPDGSYDDALKHFDKARQLRPDRALHQIEYGRTLFMMGRKAEAKAAIEKGMAIPSFDKDDDDSKKKGKSTLKKMDK